MLFRLSIFPALLIAADSAAFAAAGDVQPPPEKCRAQPRRLISNSRAKQILARRVPRRTTDLDACDGILKPPPPATRR